MPEEHRLEDGGALDRSPGATSAISQIIDVATTAERSPALVDLVDASSSSGALGGIVATAERIALAGRRASALVDPVRESVDVSSSLSSLLGSRDTSVLDGIMGSRGTSALDGIAATAKSSLTEWNRRNEAAFGSLGLADMVDTSSSLSSLLGSRDTSVLDGIMGSRGTSALDGIAAMAKSSLTEWNRRNEAAFGSLGLADMVDTSSSLSSLLGSRDTSVLDGIMGSRGTSALDGIAAMAKSSLTEWNRRNEAAFGSLGLADMVDTSSSLSSLLGSRDTSVLDGIMSSRGTSALDGIVATAESSSLAGRRMSALADLVRESVDVSSSLSSLLGSRDTSVAEGILGSRSTSVLDGIAASAEASLTEWNRWNEAAFGSLGLADLVDTSSSLSILFGSRDTSLLDGLLGEADPTLGQTRGDAISEGPAPGWRTTESGLIVPDKAQLVATAVTIYTALIVMGLFLREAVRLEERITEGNRVAIFFALLSWAQAQWWLHGKVVGLVRRFENTEEQIGHPGQEPLDG